MATLTTQDDRQATTEPAPLLGRDEMNLAEFPITLLADYAPKGEKTLTFRGGNGQLTVTGSDAYGLPTALDADVIVALIYLTKLRNDFQDVKVNFSRYELIKLLNWPDKGSSYIRLDQALNRWGGVWLVYDKCWWNNKTRRYVSAKMHILESVVITEPGRTRPGRSHPPLSTFTWNRTFIESCQADNLRQLDLATYFSLNSAISKRLYRFLGKRFYRQDDWTFDLDEIAFERVGLSRSYADAYKIKEKLRPAIDELERIGFLKPLSRHERYSRVDRGRWTIRLIRQAPGLTAPPPAAPAAGASAEAEASPPPHTAGAGLSLVAELVARGVTRTTAAELVGRHPAEAIGAKIDVFDWMTGKQDRRLARSPAGYLVKSITDDYVPPKGYVSRAERQAREEARQVRERQAAEDRRRERVEADREKAERQAIDAYWSALTAEQQAELDAAATAQADPAEVAQEWGPLRKIGQRLRRDQYIRQLLASRATPPAEA
jgi:Replication initiator protein A